MKGLRVLGALVLLCLFQCFGFQQNKLGHSCEHEHLRCTVIWLLRIKWDVDVMCPAVVFKSK